MTAAPSRRWLVASVAGLAVFVVGRRVLLPGDAGFAANLAMIVVLAVFAWAVGLRAAELGLARSSMAAGFRWGAAAFGAIAAVLLIGALVPASREALADDSAAISTGEMLFRALVRIPLGTVVMEELAFRGVLLALLLRVTSRRGAVAWSAALFSVWHLPPLVPADAASVGLTLAATAVAGVGFAWLRLRSGSLLAPIGAHLATNSVTLAIAWWLVT
jgi:uncharacterized protein